MSIATRIESIEEHIEDAYNGLAGLGADLTNVNKNIENISIVLDDIYDSMPQVSGEGTNLTLDDTRVGKIKSTLKGNTSQSGTPTPTSPIPVNVVSGDNEIVVNGKNLITFNNLVGRTWQGVDISYNNSEIIMNGTTTGDGQIINMGSNLNITLPAGTYTMSYKFGSGTASKSPGQDIAFYLRDSSSNLVTITLGQIITYSGFSTTFTINEAKNLMFYAYCNASGISLNNLVIQVQIEKGSSSSTYEPYQGNTYNIDLPVENLLPNATTSSTIQGVEYTINSDKSINVVGTATSSNSDFYIVGDSSTYASLGLQGGTYNLSGCVSGSNTTYMLYMVKKSSDNTLSYHISTGAKGLSINISNGDTFRIFIRVIANTNVNVTIYPQLEKGSKANTYTPYGTTPIELCKIGTYQDYIYKDNDKWYLHKEIGKVVLNGSENIAREQIANNHYKFYILNISNIDYGDVNYIPKILCNKLIAVGRTPMYVNTQGITSGNGSLQIYTDDTKDMTESEFRTWLGSNNIIAYYGITIPTNTEITYQPLIEQLEALEQAKSKENQTNISQINNDLPFIISASALKKG